MLESIMRYIPVAAAAALTLLTVSTALHGQRADDQIDPRSMALLTQGKAEKAAGKLDVATGTVETALAVDPRNRAAFVVLGDIAEAQGLPGRAIGLYRKALVLEPNDTSALAGEGEALVSKGATTLAKANLDRIRALCKASACPEASELAAAITKGPPVMTASAQADATPAKD
jgi:Tfp pilus assembly protein PilF